MIQALSKVKMKFRGLIRKLPIKTNSIEDFINTVRMKKGKDITMMPLFERCSPLSILFYTPAAGFASETPTGRPIVLVEYYDGAFLYSFNKDGMPLPIPNKKWIATAYNRLTKIKEKLPGITVKTIIAGKIMDEETLQRIGYELEKRSVAPYKQLDSPRFSF